MNLYLPNVNGGSVYGYSDIPASGNIVIVQNVENDNGGDLYSYYPIDIITEYVFVTDTDVQTALNNGAYEVYQVFRYTGTDHPRWVSAVNWSGELLAIKCYRYLNEDIVADWCLYWAREPHISQDGTFLWQDLVIASRPRDLPHDTDILFIYSIGESILNIGSNFYVFMNYEFFGFKVWEMLFGAGMIAVFIYWSIKWLMP